jgi:hypothetical protein
MFDKKKYKQEITYLALKITYAPIAQAVTSPSMSTVEAMHIA